MENKFKQYYDYIIKDIGKIVHAKHHNHSNFYNEVNKIRKLIKSGDQEWKYDEDFLERLLYSRDNGIVNLPYLHENFSCDKFQNLIINDRFMSALEEFMVNPTQDTHTKFEKSWVEEPNPTTGLEYNIAAINRVAPVCTLGVSTVAPIKMFDDLFNWLMGRGMIHKYPSDGNQGWFSRNQFLMKEIKQQFQSELESGETDEVYLSDFVWYLYDCVKPPRS